MPAYPQDVVVVCDQGAAAAEVAAAVERGATEAYAARRGLAADSRLLGAILEAR